MGPPLPHLFNSFTDHLRRGLRDRLLSVQELLHYYDHPQYYC